MNDPVILATFALIFLVAGTVKGAVGLGLPTTALGLTTMVIDPRTAISLVLVPMIVANAWQVLRAGDVVGAARRYWRLAMALMLAISVTITLSGDAPDGILLVSLGAALLIFVVVSVTKWSPDISDGSVSAAQIISGSIAGVMGGLTSVWAPPLVVYLTARNVGKDEFVRATGLLIFLGSLPLAWGLMRQGVLTGQVAIISTGLLVPTLAGFTVGEMLRGRLSEKAFRRLLLILFALLGLNLIRRGLV